LNSNSHEHTANLPEAKQVDCTWAVQ